MHFPVCARRSVWLAAVLLLAACSRPPLSPPAGPARPPAASTPMRELRITLTGGSSLNVYYQRGEWQELSLNIARVLRETHDNYLRLFPSLPSLSTTLALIDRDLFHVKTESPAWIHAVYYKGSIFVPLSLNEQINYYRLYRSLKHEYTHSIVAAMSGGSCPGWIDEGLAQWAEGEAEPPSQRLLAGWLLAHRPIPLNRLQRGFLTMAEQDAKIGYAQSRFAVQDLIDTHGIRAFEVFFTALRGGADPDASFVSCFGMDQQRYEKHLHARLNRWAAGYRDAQS